jgi:hypothetical protein
LESSFLEHERLNTFSLLSLPSLITPDLINFLAASFGSIGGVDGGGTDCLSVTIVFLIFSIVLLVEFAF